MNEKMYLNQKNETMGENSFMKKLLKKRLNQKGLTLIELLAVIVILAIVAAIAIPAIANLIQNQRDKAVLADASSIISAAKLAVAAGDCNLDAAEGDADACDDGNAAFKSYVGEVQGDEVSDPTADPDYYVFDDGTNGITVEYNGFNNLSDDFTATGLADNAISEANLNAALD